MFLKKKVLVIVGNNSNKDGKEKILLAVHRIGFSLAGLELNVDVRNTTDHDGIVDKLNTGYRHRRPMDGDIKMLTKDELMMPENYAGAITVGKLEEDMVAYLSDIFPSRNHDGAILCLTGYSGGDNAPLVVPPGYKYTIVAETTPTASHGAIRQVFGEQLENRA